MSWRLRSSCAEMGTSTMLPLTPLVQALCPVLQAMPWAVSRSDSSQMAASSGGNSLRSRVRRSAGRASQALRLAANRATPQFKGMACMCEVTACSPSPLPDSVPVMAQSMLPACTLETICANAVCTGVAPKAPTKSACAAEDTRTRRPDRSARAANGFLQNTTCAG